MSTNIQILLISDSEDYFIELTQILSRMEVIIHKAEGSRKGLELAEDVIPDGIIMDIQLKDTDGIELCRIIKGKKSLRNTFVLFYTKQQEEYIQIAGLNAGADDYIIRPVNARIIESRMKAVIKRSSANRMDTENVLISHGNMTIDREKYKVLVDDNQIVLPRKEFELLCLLAEKPGKVFSRRELSSQIWGEEGVLKGRTIDVHIRKIREKLGGRSIETIKGIGYKWKEGV